MEPRVITTRERYEEAIEELDRLMDRNPGKNTPDGDRLELLALLIENYEKDQFPIDNPTPIEAIKFRMDEQGLVGRDLEPFIGSRSKVSEVLSGKVPLNLRMIRELHRGLGIPLGVLTQATEQSDTENELDWSKVPIAEMVKLGWIDKLGSRDHKEDVARGYFRSAGARSPVAAFFRRAEHTRSAATPDRPALAAWLVRAMDRYGVSYGVINRRMREAGYSAPKGRMRKYSLDSVFVSTSHKHKKILEELGIRACEICGEDQVLDFCHIVAQDDEGPTVSDNCLVLCPTHHRKFDKHILKPSEQAKVQDKVEAALAKYGKN